VTSRITTRNARFQQLGALLTSRNKRHRAGEFLVQGVRPLTLALENGWEIRALLLDGTGGRSGWAREMIARVPDAERILMAPELLAELGEKTEGVPELLALVGIPPPPPEHIPFPPDFLGVALDRPSQPGNVGSIVRSADALGAHGVLVTGHGTDLFDPRAVRASTGSVFALPTAQAASPGEVATLLERRRAEGTPVRMVATDEHGDVELADADLTGPTLILVGNERAGLSRAWREMADLTVSIPMAGAASSLNAASAASIVLYEARRQRGPLPRSIGSGRGDAVR
jgi:TrmH family RNA methyltransferase